MGFWRTLRWMWNTNYDGFKWNVRILMCLAVLVPLEVFLR